jgi:hypothetical protein
MLVLPFPYLVSTHLLPQGDKMLQWFGNVFGTNSGSNDQASACPSRVVQTSPWLQPHSMAPVNTEYMWGSHPPQSQSTASEQTPVKEDLD